VTPSADAPPTRVDVVRAAQERWRHDLTELGGRNTLLWHRELPLGTFDLTVAHPGGVAKLLAGVPTRLSELVREEVAFDAARTRLAAIRDKTVELRREHGLTTGFIAVGLATWTLHRAKILPRAPVLLRRCRIHPVDATRRDYILELDRDVVFNPVLAHYLQGEAGIDLDPEELAALSRSGGGFDPRETYEELEWLCEDVDGFSIGPNTVVSTYPWAKLSLVAHLSGDAAALAAHDLVAALAGHPTRPPTVDPDPARADDPSHELSVVDADHEQRRVIDEVGRGASLVLDTPAGTGTTQTVTNMVAGALAQGQTALVVSEERPALEALRRRLAHVGLDDIVLDLPEDPRRARRAIEALATQLGAALRVPDPAVADDPLPALWQAQQTLATHEQHLHTEHEPWGQSLAATQAALARLGHLRNPPLSHVRLDLPVLHTLTPPRLAELVDVLTEAAEIGVWERGRAEDPWYGADLADDDVNRARELVAGLVGGGLTQMRDQFAEVCRVAGLLEPVHLTQWRARLELMGRVEATCDIFRTQIYEAPLEEMVAATRAKGESAERPGAVSRSRLRRQVRALLRPGPPPHDLAARVQAAHAERTEWEALAGRAARPTTPDGWEEAQDRFTVIHDDLSWLAEVLRPTPLGHDLMTTHLDLLLERLMRLDARADRLRVTARGHAMMQPLRAAGLGPLVDDLAKRGIAARDVAAEVEMVFHASLHDHLTGSDPGASAAELEQAARSLRRADRDHLRRNVQRVLRTRHRRVRRAVAAHPGQVAALREAADTGANDLRSVLARSADVVLALRPLLMGSPLVVPATLPERLRVRLVVVEHAGRTRTAHAVAAIERGSQAVICGDRHRPGPTPFTCAVEDGAQGADTGLSTLTSLLEEARLVLPVRTLGTHYRSLDQRLVAPLRHLLDPAPQGYPGVLRAPRATCAVADPNEMVPRTVDLLVQHLAGRPGQSWVVLVDRAEVREALEDAWSQAVLERRVDPRQLSQTGTEPLLMLPSDHWAGEVRDHAIWLTAPEQPMPTHRPVTALAAIRRSLTVLTPEPPADDPDNPGSRIMHDLRRPSADAEQDVALPELLADLAARLRAEGLVVQTPVGRGRYAVPLGIEDPARPGRMLVAVDTDLLPLPTRPGREQFRLRPEQLTRLGWSHTRVHSSDLFRDPAREVARLLALVREVSARPARR